MTVPVLSDLPAKSRFSPGDRLLVKTVNNLDRATADRLARAVVRWAGVDVSVVVLDALRYALWRVRELDSVELTAGVVASGGLNNGTATVSTSVVDVREGDALFIFSRDGSPVPLRLTDMVRNWAGRGVEVIGGHVK